MRQWKDTSRSGEGPAMRRDAGGGGRRGSGASWQQQGGWDEGGYEEPPAGRSGGRNRRGGRDYEDVDLERALVPTGSMLPMDAAGMGVAPGVPMIPGMPQTDEEERALGIRRPVYIPATGERKRKLGSWRVVSGVLSIMLICIASCALAGLLGKNTLARFFIGPVASTVTPITFDSSRVPVTPVATPGAKANYIKNVVTATDVDSSNLPKGLTSHFLVNDQVYVVMSVRGIPKGETHIVSIRWFYQGQDLQLPATAGTSKSVSGDVQLYFSLKYDAPGLGTAKVYLDRPSNDTSEDLSDPSLAAVINFGVSMPSPATPGGTGTPGTTTPGSGTPTGHALAPAPAAWADRRSA